MTRAAPLAIISALPVFLGCALLGASEARADYVVTIDEVGPDVVATGSGTINTSGLGDPTGVVTGNQNSTIQSANGRLQVGLGPIDFWNNVSLSGPASFGSGTANQVVTTGTGDPTGINFSDNFLSVPLGYSSNAPLMGAATWPGATFASLGLMPGTSDTWTWGSGGTAGSFTINVVPGPVVGAGLPGLIAGLGALVAMARRRRKQLA